MSAKPPTSGTATQPAQKSQTSRQATPSQEGLKGSGRQESARGAAPKQGGTKAPRRGKQDGRTVVRGSTSRLHHELSQFLITLAPPEEVKQNLVGPGVSGAG